MTKEYAIEFCEGMLDGDIFTEYTVKSDEGGYLMDVIVSPEYGDDLHVSYRLTGITEEELDKAADYRNWWYYHGDKQITVESFAMLIAAKAYNDAIDDYLDTYNKAVDETLDAYGKAIDGYMDSIKGLYE